jgi:uncharacterized peroxidase-related enzyme
MSYILPGPLDETNYPLFAEVKNQFGFVPNFYRAQSHRPDLVEAEATLVNAILINDRALTRKQKEYIFLVCSGANLNTYCVTAHCEIVRMLGIDGPEPEQVAIDYSGLPLPIALKALLNFALKLNNEPNKISKADVDALRTFGYNDEQIHETVIMVGLAKFANFVSFGLGTVPDFNNARVNFSTKDAIGAVSLVL